MGGEEGRVHIERIDAKMHEIPGMQDLFLMRRAVAKYGVGPGVADLQSPVTRIQALGRRIGSSGKARATQIADNALPKVHVAEHNELASSTARWAPASHR